jgi:outer membrane protein assembly complex protein YaeT
VEPGASRRVEETETIAMLPVVLLACCIFMQAENVSLPPTIRHVEIEGNFRFPAAGILAQLSAAPGKLLDTTVSREDLERLNRLGIFETVQLESREAGEGAVDLVFRVRERPPVSGFQVACANPAMEQLIRDHLHKEELEIRAGSPYRADQVKKAAETARRLLMARKYPLADVGIECERNGNSVQITLRLRPGPKLDIGLVSFQGNRSIPARELMRQMGNSRPASLLNSWSGGGRYLPEELEACREKLRRLYRSRGFASAAIDKLDVAVRAFPARRRMFAPWRSSVPLKIDLRIPVIEGPVFTTTSVTLEGDSKAASSEVLRLVRSLQVPNRYDYALLESTRQNILKTLGRRGYGRARVDLVQQFAASQPLVDVVFFIEPGDPMLVGRIDFAGNSRLPDKFLRRQLRLSEGDVYDSSKLDKSIERLNRSGLIQELRREDVDLQMDEEQNSIHVIFHVKEKDRRGIYATGGTGGIGGGYLGIITTAFNLLGLGEKLSFELDGGAAQSNVLLNLVADHFMGSPYSLAFSAVHRLTGLNASNIVPGPQQIVAVFRRRSNLAAVQGAYQISSKAGVGLGFQMERNSILSQSSSEGRPGGWSTSRRLTLQPSLVLDSTNGGAQQARGYQFALAQSLSGPLSSGSFDTTQNSIRLRAYRPDPWSRGRNQFAFQLSGALARPRKGQVLPVERRLFPADETVRGFAHGAIAPWSYDPASPDSSLQPAGADTVLAFSGEYRVPVRGALSAAAFLDLGWTGLGQRNLARPDSSLVVVEETNRLLRASAGGELRIMLPGFRQPARLIFAWNPLRLDGVFNGSSGYRRLADRRGSIRFALGNIF